MRALLLILLVAPAVATGQPAAHAVQVQLSSFAFAPKTLHLRAGEPVVLHLVNSSSGGHNFAAPDFFAAARIAPGSARRINDGAIEVASHQAVDIELVPARGSYRLRCTHTLHSTFGMRGSIVVE